MRGFSFEMHRTSQCATSTVNDKHNVLHKTHTQKQYNDNFRYEGDADDEDDSGFDDLPRAETLCKNKTGTPF